MKWLAIAAVVVPAAFVSFVYWRFKTRAFRAEVVIESLRLWREMVEDYRNQNPADAITERMSVAEEAVYMATHSSLRTRVWMKAWSNAKKMNRYWVQECRLGQPKEGWREIFAHTEDEAAGKLALGQLRRTGEPGELRARVSPWADPNNETCFYADAGEHTQYDKYD